MNWEENVRTAEPYIPGEQPRITGMIKLNTNECPYPPAPEVQTAAQTINTADLRLYPDPDAEVLTEGLAEYYGLRPEQVFIGVGSDDVLALAFLTFFNSGKPVFFPDITYSFYEVWAGLYRIPYEKKALDADFHIKKEDYLKENGGIIFPNPNAPTGVLEDDAVIGEIICKNQDSVVIIDEAYIDFGGKSCIRLLDKYENLLIVQTFSKSRAMAGIRIGFAAGNGKLIQYLKNVKFSFNSYTMNLPSIILGSASMKADAYFKETVGRIINTRERIKKELKFLGFTFPESYGNFIFAAHPEIPAKTIFQELKREKIYVRYFEKPRIDNYLRITIGTDEQMDTLLAVLGRICG